VWFAILDFGFGQTIYREMARYNAGITSIYSLKSILKTLEVISFILSLFIITLSSSYSNWFANSYLVNSSLPKSEIEHSFLIMGIVAGLRYCESLYHYSLMGLERYVLTNKINLFIELIRNIGSVLMIYYISQTLLAFFIWQGFCSILLTFIYRKNLFNILENNQIAGQFSLHSLKDIKKFSSSFFYITLFSIAITQVDKLYLVTFDTLESFGYYYIATIIASINLLISTPIINSYYPRMVKLIERNRIKNTFSIFYKSNRFIINFILIFTLFVVINANILLFLWTSNNSLSNKIAPILKILVVASFFSVYSLHAQSLLLALNKLRIILFVNIFTFILLLLSINYIFPLQGYYGVSAMVLISIVTQSIIFSLSIIYLQRFYNIKKFHYLFNLNDILFILLIFTLFKIFNIYMDNFNFNRFISFIVLMSVFIIVILINIISILFGKNLIKIHKYLSAKILPKRL